MEGVDASQMQWPAIDSHCKATTTMRFKLLQLNCNGIQKKAKEISDYLLKRQITVATLQETNLKERNKTPKFPGYMANHRDRGQGGGGLITLILGADNFTVMYMEQHNAGTTVVQGVNIKVNDLELKIINYYIPPTSSCPPSYRASLQALL